ncbi:MAG: DUF3014 domain-containing protein [Acidobacteria bacterium]|nr:DUF3014 domain-containing protein [Acidobacteriota bacterium]
MLPVPRSTAVARPLRYSRRTVRREFDDLPLTADDTHPALSDSGPPEEPPRGPSPILWITLAAVVLVIAAFFVGSRWFRPKSSEPPPPVGAAVQQTAEPTPAPPTPDPSIGPLPALDDSDAFVRDLVAKLSDRPELATFLVPEHLVRRFVATVDNLAEGVSPGTHLVHLRPAEGFSARKVDGRWLIDPRSYQRYDLATSVFLSLDSEKAARLYGGLRPLFDAAYEELGYPGRTFDQTLAAAIDRMLAVEPPLSPPELVPQATVFVYADPELEALPAAEKHLLRLGPENVRRVQGKLRELARAIGLPISR